ncbi:hypothetical protein EAF04_001203 [Stromatinia cepivora]|nr:hypothetical protein EAF04_001203 [Stromatinia cepivora]
MKNPLLERDITNKLSNLGPGGPGDGSNSTIPAAEINPSHTFNATSIVRSAKDIHNSIPDSDSDTFTDYTIKTPPCTIIENCNRNNDDDKHFDTSSSVPWPGSTFLIRASSSGKLLTLDSGNVVLAQPAANRGSSIHWKCIEVKGWLHFQNVASGCYLGHNFWGNIICSTRNPDGWERFTARLRPEGGYYLLMTHFERLWKLGMGDGNLAKIGEGESGGMVKTGEGNWEVIVWEFVKV